MSTRKHLRAIVRTMAEQSGSKPSKAVFYWRRLLKVYPQFHGSKHQRKNSKQPVLVYPIPKGKNTLVYPVPSKKVRL